MFFLSQIRITRKISSLTTSFVSLNKNFFCSTIGKTKTGINIPFSKLVYNFSRSSGPGGQNVNKLNTKAEIRFNIYAADWIEQEVKERLFESYSRFINKDGEFVIVCQEHRTQDANKKEGNEKLLKIIEEASTPKKERIIDPYYETEKEKSFRIKSKKLRSDVKKMRNNRNDF